MENQFLERNEIYYYDEHLSTIMLLLKEIIRKKYIQTRK
jgi:hypothetical protein